MTKLESPVFPTGWLAEPEKGESQYQLDKRRKKIVLGTNRTIEVIR